MIIYKFCEVQFPSFIMSPCVLHFVCAGNVTPSVKGFSGSLVGLGFPVLWSLRQSLSRGFNTG